MKSNHIHFAVTIPAHNEAPFIADTIHAIRQCAYPQDFVDIFVVADHCTDDTAAIASRAGACCYQRHDGERTGKGSALSWLLRKIFESGKDYQAIAIFDADTCVHPSFFEVMSARLSSGCQVVQGNHVIRNPDDGWFPALTWAMFLIDNRVQNLGRANLGLSAKNMGDSICFASALLRRFGWGEGLTEDYEFRQKLLLEGISIDYEPRALGYGYAPVNWRNARSQRSRWLRGSFEASRIRARKLLLKGIRSLDVKLLDGAFQAYLPSFSTLSILVVLFMLVSWLFKERIVDWLPFAWIVILLFLFIFPLMCLSFEHAPKKAFLVILSGPAFIIWRTWLGFSARLLNKNDRWIRTSRKPP